MRKDILILGAAGLLAWAIWRHRQQRAADRRQADASARLLDRQYAEGWGYGD